MISYAVTEGLGGSHTQGFGLLGPGVDDGERSHGGQGTFGEDCKGHCCGWLVIN